MAGIAAGDGTDVDTQKCIWMDAGVVEYQLCPLKKNCDLCDFHKKMISPHPPHVTAHDTGMIMLGIPDFSDAQFTPGIQYLKGHFWFRRIASGRLRIGMDAFMWKVCSVIHTVTSAKLMTTLLEKQCFVWLLLNGGIIYLRTPIAGQIVGINPLFQRQQNLDRQLYFSPESELWFIELMEAEQAPQDILTRDAYHSLTKTDCLRFEHLSLKGKTSPTLAASRYAYVNKREFSVYFQSVSNNLGTIC